MWPISTFIQHPKNSSYIFIKYIREFIIKIDYGFKNQIFSVVNQILVWLRLIDQKKLKMRGQQKVLEPAAWLIVISGYSLYPACYGPEKKGSLSKKLFCLRYEKKSLNLKHLLWEMQKLQTKYKTSTYCLYSG